MTPPAHRHPSGPPLARLAFYQRRTTVGFISVVLIAFFSPWATYLSLYPFLTPVTICVYFGVTIHLFILIYGRYNRSISYPEFYIALYFIVVLIGYSWSLSMLNWYNYTFWWGVSVATFAITAQFCNTLLRLKWVVYGSILGSVVVFSTMSKAVNEWGVEVDRYSVDTLNANFSAYILSGSVFMFAALSSVNPFRLKVKLIFFAYIIAIVYAEILLGTRGAVISTCAVALWYLIGAAFSRYVTIVVFITTMCAALLLSTGLFDYLLLAIDSATSRSTGDLTGRLHIWPEASRLIGEYPLLGIGTGSFIDVGDSQVGAHNLILTVLLETGFVGLCIMFMFFVSVFSSIMKNMDREVGAYILMLFAMYFVPIATSGHWEGSPFSWLLVAFTYNLARVAKPGWREE